MNKSANPNPTPTDNGYTDQAINCLDCKVDFTFTARDQEFYASQNPPFTPPKRCKPCRDQRKATREGRDGGYNSRGGYTTPSTPAPATTVAYEDRGGGGGRRDSKRSKRRRFDEFED